MPRLREVPRSEAPSALVSRMYDYIFGPGADPAGEPEPGPRSGPPGDWWTVFANSADVFEHAVAGFRLYQSPRRRLPPVLRELAQTRVGWAAGSRFVYSQHAKALRDLGPGEEKVAAVGHWPAADCFSEEERLVLAYTDCLALDHGRVPDQLFESLRHHLDDEQLLELTYIATLYLAHAVTSRALRLEYDDVDDLAEVPGGHESEG